MVSFRALLAVTMAGFAAAAPYKCLTPTMLAHGSMFLVYKCFTQWLTLTDGTELPAPPATMTLKAIALGRGTQNYTCATPSSTAVPVQLGAKATLYDASLLAATNPAVFNTLPGRAVQVSSEIVADVAAQMLHSNAVLGVHYFDSTGVPVFDLGSTGFFRGAKIGDIPAPAGAPVGPAGTGAVDWLDLSDKGGSIGLGVGYFGSKVQHANNPL
jgi:hypothetical protein